MLDAVLFFETFSSELGVADELVAPGDNSGCRTSMRERKCGSSKSITSLNHNTKVGLRVKQNKTVDHCAFLPAAQKQSSLCQCPPASIERVQGICKRAFAAVGNTKKTIA